MRVVFAFLVALFAITDPVAAANLCVKAGGSDATAKASIVYVAGNEAASTCWQTIGRGVWGSATRSTPDTVEAVAAGDTLFVFGGTYNFNTLNCSPTVGVCRFTVLYNPVNAGTSTSNMVTITCVGDCVVTAQEWNGPAIGCSGLNYCKWFADVTLGHSWQLESYVPLDNNAASTQVDVTSDTGPVVLQGGTGLWMEGLSAFGGPTGPNDNYNAIRIENCTDCVARNNYAQDFTTGDNHGSLFTIYHSPNYLLEQNHSLNNDGFLDVKNQTGAGGTAMSWGRVRFNKIEAGASGFYCFVFSVTEVNEIGDTKISQNICSGVFHGVFSTGAIGADDIDLINNTFYNLSGPVLFIGPYNLTRFWNNIVRTATHAVYSEASTMPIEADLDLEHNDYFGLTTNFYAGTDGVRTRASFDATYAGQHVDSPASSDADPRLADPGNGDFRLCTAAGVPHASCAGASPAINMGVDTLDLDGDLSTTDNVNAGAIVTGTEVIGLQTTAAAGVAGPGKVRIRRREPPLSQRFVEAPCCFS